ncbi:MAG: penicillin-binding protein 2 [Clostridiales bacterium]|jgi:penicillin-binding protein 2|nr:penicillin-binding protein 2 [Clostridiales bacterium]
MKAFFHKILSAVSSRYTILGVFVVLFACAMIFRLFSLQIIQGGQFVQTAAQTRETRRITEAAPRGRVTDRNGVPIAVNSEVFTVQIVRTGQFDGEHGIRELNRVLLELCGILEKNSDTWLRNFERYLAFTDGAPVFAREDQKELENWQKNTLKLGETEVRLDAAELFAYLRSERMYEIDETYSDEEAFRIMSLRCLIDAGNGAFDAGQSVCLARGVRPMSIAEIEEKSRSLHGVVIGAAPVREYRNARNVAHVLGYTGAITEAQYETLKDDGYNIDDTVGQYGIEAQNEAYLRGRNGERRVELLENGTVASEFAGRPAVPGSDVVLTIDMDLQEVAVDSLLRNIEIIRGGESNGYVKTDSDVNFRDADAGAAVAVDVRTGEVLVMASVPSFDASIFLAGPEDRAAQQAISALWEDPLHASWNRAIQGTYSPGSTFKPITAITALQEGVINRNTQIYDAGAITIGERHLYCLEGGHGWLTLRRALETSCNVFFYDVGTSARIDNLEKWAKLFGLGVKTGIDLPYEKEGTMSSIAFKEDRFNDFWRPADTAQVSIGQLYNSFTPLQMACYMAALANGGEYYRPFVTKKVVRYDGSTVHETEPELRRIPADPENIDAVKEGMIASTTEIDGTSTIVFRDFPYPVAGKTGTAETGFESQEQSSNSIFVCYAPADDPQIAVVVVIEKGVWGSYTAPVARDILEAYFGLKNGAQERDAVYGAASDLIP